MKVINYKKRLLFTLKEKTSGILVVAPEGLILVEENNIKEDTDISGKLDKVSTAGVERAYIINADGSQGTKATSDFKDVLEFANLASFPAVGEIGKIYIAISPSNLQYRWTGTTYVAMTNGFIASTNDVPEGSSNLYFTTARVLSTLLTGISLVTGGAIVSTDSVLVAFGKIQKQLNDIGTALGLKQDTLTDTNFGAFTNSVADKNTQVDTDILGYIDVTTGKWVKQTFSKTVDYLKGFFVTKKAIITNATVSGTYNIDASLADTYKLTLTGNTTLALINTSSTYAEPMTVYITGLYTLAYPAGATLIGEYLGNRKNQLVIEKTGSEIFITINNYV